MEVTVKLLESALFFIKERYNNFCLTLVKSVNMISEMFVENFDNIAYCMYINMFV